MRPKKDFHSYSEAQAVVQALGIKNFKDYKARYRQDPRLPSNPNSTYANSGWRSWPDFLGTKRSHWYTYAETKAVALALGIKDSKDYQKRYRLDPRLPAGPNQIYANAGWTNWYDFLDNEKRPAPYATYAEAQAAIQALGVTDAKDYRARYQQDPRLPSSPEKIYVDAGWANWCDFLGTKSPPWYTYAEAKAAAQVLDITDKEDYAARYRQDARLPASPDRVYSNAGWTNWYDFLGKKKSPWYTYTEAKTAVQALGIKNSKDYPKHYRQDPKLPSSPYQTYASVGWTNWDDFLGKKRNSPYATYFEAQEAAQALRIKSQPDYHKRYRQNPRLPSNPVKTYANTGWTSWYDFLGTDAPRAVETEYPRIWADFVRWLSGTKGYNRKRAAIRALLAGFYREQCLPDDSRYLLLRSNQFNAEAYQQFIEAQAETMKVPYHSAIAAFFGWLLDEYCTDEDANERIVLPEYRNPFVTVLAGFADRIEAYRPSQSTKVPLGYEYILRGRQFLVPNGEQVLQTRPSFADLPHLQEFFNNRADWLSVNRSLIDNSDPNCIWRKIEKNGQEAAYQIWSPVRFVAIYTLLRFPLRGQQILWLDSGEADSEIAVLDGGGGIRWEKNIGPLVGKGSKKRRLQAAVQRDSKDMPKIYVTTNKTGRTEGGYEVAWIPDDLVYWFVLLRNWQAKYNPLSAPTSWSNVGLDNMTNSKILHARGTQCFLFRTGASGTPMSTTTAFFYSLPALLYKIQRDDENLAIKNPDQHSRQRYLSPYTPHSLRVSLITAFIIDGGTPIPIISKLVGHSSLVMTIYYTKVNSGQMRQVMGEAEKRIGQLAKEEFSEKIRNQGLHSLRHQLIATDGNRLLLEADVPNSACVVFDHGICPMSASSCDEGGEIIVERQNIYNNIYGPVEVGYLGKKNCPRCRFFVTGVPFLGGLVATANEIALEIHTESKRYQDFTAEVERLEQEFYDVCQKNQPDIQQSKRKQVSALQQQSAAKLDSLLTDYVAINRYIQSCLKLINEDEQDSESQDAVRLITASDFREVGIAFEESNTQYHLLAEICQNATIYLSANPSRALPLIAQAIDRMAENNDLAPAMFRLSDEQKLVVTNELNQLLLQRLGSWEKIDDLFAGDLMLLDVDSYEPKLTRISTEIRQLLSRHSGACQISNEVPANE